MSAHLPPASHLQALTEAAIMASAWEAEDLRLALRLQEAAVGECYAYHHKEELSPRQEELLRGQGYRLEPCEPGVVILWR